MNHTREGREKLNFCLQYSITSHIGLVVVEIDAEINFDDVRCSLWLEAIFVVESL